MQELPGFRMLMPSESAAAGRLPSLPPDRSAAGAQRQAAAGERERLKAAAQEFEALFLNCMLQVMRGTIEESGLGEKGFGQSVYTEMFDQELARSLAARGALGISGLLMRSLSDVQEVPAAQGEGQPSTPDGTSGLQVGEGTEPGEIPEFHMPVNADVSSRFGIRRDPFTHQARMHRGLDIAAPDGMQVKAAGGGRVLVSGLQEGYGNTVVLEHPGGFTTRYAHLGSLAVRAGELLQPGQVLGTVGSTGRSTGPHLHFEVSRNGDRIDPASVLAE